MKGPIDFNSPLGISKREWTKVLGANLALLFIVYVVALVCTMCGSDLFVIKTGNDGIIALADKLNSWGIYPLVSIAFSTVETTLIIWFVILKRPKWWVPLSYFAVRVLNNLIFLWSGASFVPTWSFFVINFAFCASFVVAQGKGFVKPLLRFVIALAVSLSLGFADRVLR